MAKSLRPTQPVSTRGTLTPMKVSQGFVAFVLEQLQAVKGLRSKAMFGGVGLYAGDVFFGLLARDMLFLKVDDSNRGQYEAAGMTAFKPYADKPMLMPYFQVPVHVLEDAEEVARWAGQSVGIAASGNARKTRPRSSRRPLPRRAR